MISRIVTNIFKKSVNSVEKKDVHPLYPKNNPADIKINGLITVNSADFILYDTKISIKEPEASCIINAISTTQFREFNITAYRAYFESKGNSYILQIHCDSNKKPLDAILFYVQDELYPQTKHEWLDWIGENGLIGAVDFCTPNEVWYNRDWKPISDHNYHVNPYILDELVFTDKYSNPKRIKLETMLYSREIVEGSDKWEYLLASVISNENERLVSIWSGIPLELNEVTIY